MAQNSLAPGFIKLFVQSAYGEHVHTLPCKPFLGVGGVWYVEERTNPVGQPWYVALLDYVNVAKLYLSTASTFTYAELWTVDSPTVDPIYRDSTVVGVAGTIASAATATLQVTFSLRTDGGGVAKLVLLDITGTPNTRAKPPYTGAALTFSNYVLGGTNFIVGRDNSWPIALPKIVTKLNDALRRKYNLA